MLTLLFVLVGFALSTPESPAESPAESSPAFDEARAKAYYESFFYELFMRDWPDDDYRTNELRGSAARQRPVVTVAPWPTVPAHGIYCNDTARLRTFKWVAVGRTEPPTQQPDQKPYICALTDMSYTFYYGYRGHVAPDLCVARPGVTGAWQGAAACYFAAIAEYDNPGFWVALREVDGQVVIAGVLEHKEALEEPESDRRLKPFLAAIEKRFGPQPPPKEPKKPKAPKRP